jgi:hypothetical protein
MNRILACAGISAIFATSGVAGAATPEGGTGEAVEALRCGNIALLTYNGHYLVAEGGGGREVAATRTEAREWETFHVVDRGNGNIALRAYNGQYVTAEGGGGSVVNANRTEPREWETFHVVSLGGDNIALQAYNGQYVTAEGGGGGAVNANRTQIREWETFTMVCK